MRSLIIVCILILVCVSSASAYTIEKTTFDGKNFVPIDNSIPLVPNDWTAWDTGLQVTALLLLAVDRYQSVQITDKNLQEVGWAQNFVGSHPSSGQVNRYNLVCAIGHTAIAMAIPKDWEIFNVPVRNIWQLVFIGVEANAITKNYEIGLKYGLW